MRYLWYPVNGTVLSTCVPPKLLTRLLVANNSIPAMLVVVLVGIGLGTSQAVGISNTHPGLWQPSPNAMA